MRAEGIETVRRILCVFPRYTSSFGTFEYAYPLTDGVQAFMPPQGLLLIAAYLPANWPVRFIDENIRPATKEDFEWAEPVFVSGIHIQRLKTPQQIVAELDRLRECGMTDTIYFVDDNFIGNRKAALDLLPHLVEWQKRTGYITRLACEATLNIAKRPEILTLMREAMFVTVFCGIETPDPDALPAMHKDHKLMVPTQEGTHTSN